MKSFTSPLFIMCASVIVVTVTALKCPHASRLVNSTSLQSRTIAKCLQVETSTDTIGFKSVYVARKRCTRLGGEIASFENEQIERQALELLAMTLTPKLIKRIYIGLNDLAQENKFTWFDNSQVNYFRWGPEEPNNLHEDNEDCVVLRTDEGLWRHEKDTEWQDYPCCHSTGIRAILCQFNQTEEDFQDFDISRYEDANRVQAPPKEDDLLAVRCLENINECVSSPCENNASCTDGLGTYSCNCVTGFSGLNCENIDCPMPSPLDLANAERSGGMDLSNGSTVNYTCKTDFEIVNKSSIQQIICVDGFWMPDRLSLNPCTAIPLVPCPVIQSLLGIRADRTTRAYAGDVINYTCAVGYVFDNESQSDVYQTSNCSSEGVWTPKLLECKDIAPPLKKIRIPPVEAENAVLVGTVAVLFFICELAVVVLMDVDHLARHLKIMKNNLANGASRVCH